MRALQFYKEQGSKFVLLVDEDKSSKSDKSGKPLCQTPFARSS